MMNSDHRNQEPDTLDEADEFHEAFAQYLLQIDPVHAAKLLDEDDIE